MCEFSCGVSIFKTIFVGFTFAYHSNVRSFDTLGCSVCSLSEDSLSLCPYTVSTCCFFNLTPCGCP